MTQTHYTDKQGRPWAKLSELKVGDVVVVDSGFTCMAGQRLVCRDERGLYLMCDNGHHYLSGQQDCDGEHCVGIYKVKDTNEAVLIRALRGVIRDIKDYERQNPRIANISKWKTILYAEEIIEGIEGITK